MKLNPHEAVLEFAQQCKEKMSEFDKAIVRCGVIGIAKTGKSSLINAIAGEQVCAVGCTEQTRFQQEYHHNGLVFVDLPGCGTENHPSTTYVEDQKLLSFDLFILVYSGAWLTDNNSLVAELRRMRKPFFIVRSMFDQAVEGEWRDNRLSEDEVRGKIQTDLVEKLGATGSPKAFMVSAWRPTQYDLEALLESIARELDGVKRQRFLADMVTIGEAGLRKKREVLEGLLPYYAGGAAANGLNPIPGLDIAADLAILLKFAHQVASVYGLDKKQWEFAMKMIGPERIPVLVAKVGQFTASYLAKEGIALVLKRVGVKAAGRQVVKYVPFVGPLIAAGIGWKATFMLGEDLIDEAESLAREILHAVAQQTAS